MKISILTATYNREKYLTKLYESILENSKYEVQLEWLIMDDGSNDNTKKLIESFIQNNSNSDLEIKYFYQENQGKMVALNNLIVHANSDLLIECDSDDYLKNNAIKIIKSKYEQIKDKKNIYAMAFLKYDQNLCNIGSTYKDDNYESNMFNLYFKNGLLGDKALVFITNIRKQYLYRMEKNEKFSTEARLYNEMDKNYNVICFNYPIMICEYLQEGYTKNIQEIFKNNPYGYYEYFKQLLSFDMKGVLFSKRLYIIKHYILFSYLTNKKNILKDIKDIFNKILIVLLFIPGYIKSYIKFKK